MTKRALSPLEPPRKSAKEMDEKTRFMSHVSKSADGCWLWTAFRMPSGYGNFRTPARHELAHRASYRLFCGPLDGRDVMHACDNTSCVNPAHLSLGTRKENMQDAAQKGRMRRGASHGRAKLTEEQAIFVKQSTLPQVQIAKQVGITQSTVSAIKSGKKWSHLHEGNYHR